MTWGLTTEQWEQVKLLAIDPLKSYGARVFVFGSRARGDCRPFSDLDLLYESGKPIALNQLNHIRASLEASALPINIDIAWEGDLATDYRPGILKERVEV